MARANGASSLVGIACMVDTAPERLLLSDKVLRLVPRLDVADSKFLNLILSSTDVRRQIQLFLNGSSGQNNISQEAVRCLRVPIVPLGRQRRIVDAVAAVSRDLEALEHRIDKLQVLRDALIHSVAMTAPSISPTGEVPWARLGDCLLDIETGRSPAAESSPARPGEWGVLKVSAVRRGRFDFRQNKAIHDAEFINPAFEVKDGDLLMTRANTEELLGLACIVRGSASKLMLSDKTLRLVVDTAVADPRYLEIVLGFPQVRHEIQAAATGTSGSMKNIGQHKVRNLRIPLPPLEVQHRVIATAEHAMRQLAVAEARADKLRIIQDALAEDLLSGRVRVSDL